MDNAKEESDEKKALPEGFMLIPFHQVLNMMTLTIALVWLATFSGSSEKYYTMFIIVPFVILLAIMTFVVRRRMRKFIRDNGDVEIITTFAHDRNRTRKNILNREVSELIDDGIDRLLDGKEEKKP